MLCFALLLGWRRELWRLVPAGVLVTASGVGLAAYYWWLTGSPLPNYGDHGSMRVPGGTILGLFGTLFDQQWGLLLYTPLYLLTVLGVIAMLHMQRRELGRCALVAVPYLLLVCSYSVWWAEWNPPGRYAVAILPLCAVPIAASLRVLRTAFGRTAACLLATISLLVCILGMWQPWLLYNHPTGKSRLLLLLGERLTHLYLPSLFPSLVQLVGSRDLALTVCWAALTCIVVTLLWAFGRPGNQPRDILFPDRKESS
jgi:hypothetical protein